MNWGVAENGDSGARPARGMLYVSASRTLGCAQTFVVVMVAA